MRIECMFKEDDSISYFNKFSLYLVPRVFSLSIFEQRKGPGDEVLSVEGRVHAFRIAAFVISLHYTQDC